jgi:MSHA pilin protein MshA
MSQRGFTLIELIIVIVILGILATVAAPRFIDISSDARKTALIGVQTNFESGLRLVRIKQQFIDRRLPSHNSRQYWIDMNNNGIVDGDSSNNQNSFEGRDGIDILAFNNGEIDNYQLHKLINEIEGIVVMHIPSIQEVDIGFDTDEDGEVGDNGFYITFHQITGFTRHFDSC